MKIICMIPEIWCTTDRIFSNFGPFFALLHPLPPLTTNRIKILRQWKNTWRYHHFTQVHHKWQSYDFWSTWAIFCPFNPLPPPSHNSLKNKNFKKRKKTLEISSFYTSAPKIMTIGYNVPEIWHVMDVIAIFHFGLYFSILPP